MAESPFHLFGIRHHGPGCARSLLAALQDLQPDCLLVEGPPEGEVMLPLLLDASLLPPVALLVYDPEDASEAAFYPFADFSPEWNALRFGLAQGIPTRFIDLPISHRIAMERAADAAAAASPEPHVESVLVDDPAQEAADADVDAAEDRVRDDPLDWLGRAAGYGDGESWWNHMVEERDDSLELFVAIREAMTTLRQEAPVRPLTERASQREVLREAHMRKCLREAQKEGFQRIAVVCGAWHVPALAELPAAKADNALLKGLPKVKVVATWVPWSYSNLAYASGYGAGMASPGWYEHLWLSQGGERAIGWLARAARLFRERDLDCSSAHVIEAVRLADALAALRERPQPGLDELNEALRTVVCMGEDGPMRLIERELMLGERIGSTPDAAPAVPLQRDLDRWQKSLRLKLEANERPLDLDLRKEGDLARSHLFHRLALLGIDWARLSNAGRSARGSFHEVWVLQWDPALVLRVIEASRWGNNVLEAATARAVDQSSRAQALPELSELVQRVLLADLELAIGPVTQRLEDLAALASDTQQLLRAIPPLVQVARYGNVRRTDAGMVEHLLTHLVPRAAIGLAGACGSLDDEAAQTMRDVLLAAHQAIALLAREELRDAWQPALRQLTEGSSHALIAGLAARLLFDAQVEPSDDMALRMSRALSLGMDPPASAAWLEGFLNGSGMVLLHDDRLWSLVDVWLSGLGDEHFVRVLPLLRRAFSEFSAPERRQLGERARRPAATATIPNDVNLDAERAARVLPVLRQILGVEA